MTGKNSRTPGKRAPLNAQIIATEAMALIDAEGLDGFSFRKLAQRLRCQAMSLYHYYPSKAHLFDALIDICLDETPVPPPDLPPRARLHGLAMNYRAMALRHAAFTPFLCTHRLNHRHALAWLDQVAGIFTATDLDSETAARVFRSFSYYATGAAMDEALGYARGPSAAELLPTAEAARDFPAIMAMGPYFAPDQHLPTFEAGLAVLLDWFDRELEDARSPDADRRKA